jgi:hypothetical protein
MPKEEKEALSYIPGDGETLFVIISAADQDNMYLPPQRLSDSQHSLWEEIAKTFLTTIRAKHHVV